MIAEQLRGQEIGFEQERKDFSNNLESALIRSLQDNHSDVAQPSLETVAPASLDDEDFPEDPHEWVRAVANGITSQWTELHKWEKYEESTQSGFGSEHKHLTGRVFEYAILKPTYSPPYEVITDGVINSAVRWTQQVVEARGLQQQQALQVQSVMTELAVRIAGGIVASDGIQRQGASAGYFIKRTILERSPFTKGRSEGNKFENPSTRVY